MLAFANYLVGDDDTRVSKKTSSDMQFNLNCKKQLMELSELKADTVCFNPDTSTERCACNNTIICQTAFVGMWDQRPVNHGRTICGKSTSGFIPETALDF